DLQRVSRAAESVAPPATRPPPAVEAPGKETPSVLRRTREAERRQVTALVCGSDLFCSEAFLANFDAEDQDRVLHDFRQTCEPALRRFDGAVVQCDDKGLLACFGYPVAHEDTAPRAARAALSLLDDLQVFGDELRQSHRVELRPWVGLHTGPAVVGA